MLKNSYTAMMKMTDLIAGGNCCCNCLAWLFSLASVIFDGGTDKVETIPTHEAINNKKRYNNNVGNVFATLIW